MNVKTVYVEITNQCNLNCRTCYNRSGLNQIRQELSAQQIETILQRFLPYGLKRFLFSGGEPTLHTEFNQILDLVDKYPDLSFGIVTNGTNHNPKLIEYLNTRDNFTLQISLDGSNEKQNAKTRGAGNFAKTIAFAKKIRKTDPKPLLKMVISQNNFDDVADYCDLALSLGFVPELAFIYKSGNGSELWDSKALTAQQKVSVLKLVEKLNEEKNAGVYLPLCTSNCPYVVGLNDLSLCIKTDGSIQPCQMIYDSAYSVGNALAFDPKQFKQRLETISALAKKRFETDYDCAKCLLKFGCGKGCMGNALSLNSDPLSDDGNCEYRKLQFIRYHLKGVLSSIEKGSNPKE